MDFIVCGFLYKVSLVVVHCTDLCVEFYVKLVEIVFSIMHWQKLFDVYIVHVRGWEII